MALSRNNFRFVTLNRFCLLSDCNCMPFLENVFKPLYDDPLGKFEIYTRSVFQWATIVCTPLPLSAGEEGIGPPTIFSEKWHVTHRISIFRRGLRGKRKGWGGAFVRVDGMRLQFLHKK